MSLTISTIIGGTIFMNSMQSKASFLRDAGLPENLLHDLSGENAMANVMLGSTLTNSAWDQAIKDSFAFAMRNMWICYTAFAFLGVIASFFIKASHLGTEQSKQRVAETRTAHRGLFFSFFSLLLVSWLPNG